MCYYANISEFVNVIYLFTFFRNIYWTDSNTKSVSVAKNDGRYRKVLVSRDLFYPLAIAVNPRLGYVYVMLAHLREE